MLGLLIDDLTIFFNGRIIEVGFKISFVARLLLDLNPFLERNSNGCFGFVIIYKKLTAIEIMLKLITIVYQKF